jgi:hypothetical protein
MIYAININQLEFAKEKILKHYFVIKEEII